MVQWRLLGTAASLVAIWLAVLFIGVFGGDIVAESGVVGGVAASRSVLPVIVVVAPLAVIATFFVAWFAYRSEKAYATLSTAGHDRRLASAPAPADKPLAIGHR
jgi:hypothetical protein